MLALDHRISDAIDLFVDRPGGLPYISPRLDSDLQGRVSGYNEDADYVKLRVPDRVHLNPPW